jgi:nucleoside 2-deoxyribosyltransferase
MIHVTGGAYLEFCIEPIWEQLFGSGVRAAAALSEMSDQLSLTTYIGDAHRATLESMAAAFNFELMAASIPATIQFHYYHGLSEPRIRPALHMINQAASQTVEAPNILRFGFLEGNAVVRGEYVVYDPQDAYNPRSFHENGSTAEKLAIVANLREAIELCNNQYTGAELELLGKAVLEREEAEVVVIKRGSFGATVVTATEIKNIAAYRTSRIWPIGSGDVFAAIFAFHWATKKVDAFEAARLASLSTAYYCQNNSLPIPVDVTNTFTPVPIINGPSNFPFSAMQVYIAGPFFTMAQRWMIDQSRVSLAEQGFKVFSPFHDVGYGSASEVVPTDITALKASAVVFAILDGLDSGTLFEIGYARAMNKPVVAFVQNESEDALKMLMGTDCEIVDDFVSAIYRTTWAAMAL